MSEVRYRLAAKAGNPDAMVLLSQAARERDDQLEAERWMRRAAGLGHRLAMHDLGRDLEDGEFGGPGRHIEEAEVWFRRSADLGHSCAAHDVSRLMADRGDSDALEWWLRRSADLGSLWGMDDLGQLLAEQGDLEEAERWWRRAADLDGYGGIVSLARLLTDRGNLEEAEYWWRTLTGRHRRRSQRRSGMKGLIGIYEALGETDAAERWRTELEELFRGPPNLGG
jgi:TPR repeat protein